MKDYFIIVFLLTAVFYFINWVLSCYRGYRLHKALGLFTEGLSGLLNYPDVKWFSLKKYNADNTEDVWRVVITEASASDTTIRIAKNQVSIDGENWNDV